MIKSNQIANEIGRALRNPAESGQSKVDSIIMFSVLHGDVKGQKSYQNILRDPMAHSLSKDDIDSTLKRFVRARVLMKRSGMYYVTEKGQGIFDVAMEEIDNQD